VAAYDRNSARAATLRFRKGCVGQFAQVVGALLILAAYAAAQFGRLSTHSRGYLLLNIAGSGILAVLALDGRQWGFVLLEGVWALLSLWGLAAGLLGKQSPSHH
jgi:hypothetical protein